MAKNQEEVKVIKLLVNCKDDYEARLIEGLLATADIPVHREYRGTGLILKVYAGLGRNVDIYVPAGRWQEAQALLQARGDWDEECWYDK